MGQQSDHNLRQLLIGTGEFLWARGATTLAEAQAIGFQDFGNITGIEAQQSSEERKHFGAYRGKKKLDRTHTTSLEMMYNITLDEIDKRNLGILCFGNPDYDFGAEAANNAHAGLAAVAGSGISFTAGNPVRVGVYYDILDAAGNALIDITTVTFAGGVAQFGAAQDAMALVEGVDYEVDLKNGMVKFLRAFAADTITPTITAAEVTPSSGNFMAKLKPLQQGFQEGFGIIRIYDQDTKNNLVLEHTDFRANLTIDGNVNLATDDFAELTMKLSVLVPEGNLFVRD